ncbi:uncharacterized protein BDW43DRAFT_41618 [Aspergillus alliaceus]|uniref:uncharacterized protein n=1 Tax=Petromyces alliaceus TaxID=209559 RepID=UPI0012A4E215|nr:uncharacterized protein BDW43DRAFT_41618 [Aspergillus alliaceus]KAB8235158.1 hypothetical protein BDW43DRAFT_41618 [Aspergillus alliaceus]
MSPHPSYPLHEPHATLSLPHYCSHCDREVSSKEALTIHTSLNLNRAHWCTRCSRAFPSQTAKAAHTNRSPAHHHTCTHCPDADFQTEKDLNSHLGNTDHACQICKKVVPTTEALNIHPCSRRASLVRGVRAIIPGHE